MSCCGSRRRAAKAYHASHPIRLRFLGEGTIEAKGFVTGNTYLFSKEAPETDVDPRDIRGFTQHPSFLVVKRSLTT